MNIYREIGSQCMALHVRRAARRVGRIYDAALRQAGINNGQFSMMTMLAARQDWTMQQLADALALDQSSLSAAVKPMLGRGLVEVSPSSSDRRVRVIRLTVQGRSLLERARPLWRSAQTRVEARLGLDEAGAVRAALAALGPEGLGNDSQR